MRPTVSDTTPACVDGNCDDGVPRRTPIRGKERGDKKLNTIGRHLIAEFYGCSTAILDHQATIETHMLAAAETIGATVVGHTFHRFSPQGVSGSVVIAESHLSIHTWPENGYVSIDIYTCGGLDPRPGFEYLATALDASSYRVQEIVRGLPEDVAGQEFGPTDVQIMSQAIEPVVHIKPSQLS